MSGEIERILRSLLEPGGASKTLIAWIRPSATCPLRPEASQRRPSKPNEKSKHENLRHREGRLLLRGRQLRERGRLGEELHYQHEDVEIEGRHGTD